LLFVLLGLFSVYSRPAYISHLLVLIHRVPIHIAPSISHDPQLSPAQSAAAKKRSEWAKDAAMSLAVKTTSEAAKAAADSAAATGDEKEGGKAAQGNEALTALKKQQAEMLRQQQAIMVRRVREKVSLCSE
jgi:hypothetical protein